jgi:hypothetical protein
MRNLLFSGGSRETHVTIPNDGGVLGYLTTLYNLQTRSNNWKQPHKLGNIGT